MVTIPENVSVIMPVYNAEKYIAQALDSIFKQTVAVSEILIIDDGSTDKTKEIINTYKESFENIRLITNSENRGVSFSRNCGIELANSPWILFLDADDVLPSNLVEFFLRLKAERQTQMPDIDWAVFYPSYQQIDEHSRKIGGLFEAEQYGVAETLGYLVIRNTIISPSGVFCKKKVLQRYGNFNIDRKHSEDYELWLKIAGSSGVGYISSPAVYIRRHNNNASRELNRMIQAEKEILLAMDLSNIKYAIFRRNLSVSRNTAEYSSLLFRLDLWKAGYESLKSLREDQQSYQTLFYMALFFIKENSMSDAVLYLEKSLDLNRYNAAAFNNLAAINIIKNNNDKAKELLNSALAIAPGFMDAQSNLDIVTSKRAVDFSDIKFTWRELRQNLLKYHS